MGAEQRNVEEKIGSIWEEAWVADWVVRFVSVIDGKKIFPI
jgi:hypothetical protein